MCLKTDCPHEKNSCAAYQMVDRELNVTKPKGSRNIYKFLPFFRAKKPRQLATLPSNLPQLDDFDETYQQSTLPQSVKNKKSFEDLIKVRKMQQPKKTYYHYAIHDKRLPRI